MTVDPEAEPKEMSVEVERTLAGHLELENVLSSSQSGFGALEQLVGGDIDLEILGGDLGTRLDLASSLNLVEPAHRDAFLRVLNNDDDEQARVEFERLWRDASETTAVSSATWIGSADGAVKAGAGVKVGLEGEGTARFRVVTDASYQRPGTTDWLPWSACQAWQPL